MFRVAKMQHLFFFEGPNGCAPELSPIIGRPTDFFE